VFEEKISSCLTRLIFALKVDEPNLREARDLVGDKYADTVHVQGKELLLVHM